MARVFICRVLAPPRSISTFKTENILWLQPEGVELKSDSRCHNTTLYVDASAGTAVQHQHNRTTQKYAFLSLHARCEALKPCMHSLLLLDPWLYPHSCLILTPLHYPCNLPLAHPKCILITSLFSFSISLTCFVFLSSSFPQNSIEDSQQWSCWLD